MSNTYEEFAAQTTESTKDMETRLRKAAAADPKRMKKIAKKLLDEIMPATDSNMDKRAFLLNNLHSIEY